MRILFTHSYSMSEVRALCDAGRYPRQHLWGADALERAGHEVVWGPFGGDPRLARLTRLTRGKLGYLDQEVAIARAADSRTLVYSGDQSLTRGLAYLGRHRLMSIFHSIGRPTPASSWVRRIQLALCLSERTRDVLIREYGRDPERTLAVRWGPDLGYAGYAAAATRSDPAASAPLIVSAGKTGRDLATLRAALARTGLSARIHALAPGEPPRDLNAILADMRSASAIAIPLDDPGKLLGLSEFNDAIALGKPVVMTRSPHFDFDIEAAGFGIWVDPFDADGWSRALARIASDPAEAQAMGRRAREFAEREWNYELFSRSSVDFATS